MRLGESWLLRVVAAAGLFLFACGLTGCERQAGAGTQGPLKVLRLPMATEGPKTLDPILGSTTYENRCIALLYETLVQYKYLKRPLELEPLLLAEMPSISEDGKTWRFRLREGVYFQDSPCFPGGTGREVKARDVIYSWKRLADPVNKEKNWWLLDGQIVGFNEYKDEQSARVKAGEKFDYDAPVSGMRVLGDYEFEIELTEAVQQFAWKLAMFQLSVVPREAVEAFGTKFSGRPVGTGPFMLADESDWLRGVRIRFTRNPKYREAYYPDEWMPEDEEYGFHLPAGKRIPMVDRVDVTFFVEAQPQWLEFKARRLDMTTVPDFAFEQMFSRRTKELKRSVAREGIVHFKVPLLDFIFRGFNMEDPLVGGYMPGKKALRQAISLAMDWEELNEAYYWGTAVVYDGPIPPGLDGFPEGPGNRAPVSYRGPDYAKAREKLVEAGYRVGADGLVKDLPPIDFYTGRGAVNEKITALMERNFAEVGIRLNPRYVDFSELIEAVNNKKAQFFSFAWGSDYPDAENNLALFYSPNVSPGSNHFNYSRTEYDAMYEAIRTMPAGSERTAMYETMRDMIIEDAPYAGAMARTRYYLNYPWLRNFKPTENFFNYVKYLDVDMEHPDRPR
ncbi:MAG: hypothetical protein KJZ65_00905 [Phycisphaerales bacterium]|nr:hypothetical protein [Phycisphaerales bacterium]